MECKNRNPELVCKQQVSMQRPSRPKLHTLRVCYSLFISLTKVFPLFERFIRSCVWIHHFLSKYYWILNKLYPLNLQLLFTISFCAQNLHKSCVDKFLRRFRNAVDSCYGNVRHWSHGGAGSVLANQKSDWFVRDQVGGSEPCSLTCEKKRAAELNANS